MFNVPLPSHLRYFFSPKIWGLLRPKYPQKIQKNKYLAKKIKPEKEPDSSKARQGHIKHACKKSGSNAQKWRRHWHLKDFFFFCLNQPLVRTQHRKLAVDHTDCTAYIWQHALYHTDHESIFPKISRTPSGNRSHTDHLSEVWTLCPPGAVQVDVHSSTFRQGFIERTRVEKTHKV